MHEWEKSWTIKTGDMIDHNAQTKVSIRGAYSDVMIHLIVTSTMVQINMDHGTFCLDLVRTQTKIHFFTIGIAVLAKQMDWT